AARGRAVARARGADGTPRCGDRRAPDRRRARRGGRSNRAADHASPGGARPNARGRAPPRLTVFFSLSSWAVGLIIFGIVGATATAGYLAGRYLREHEAKLREPYGVLQGALLGVVGLLLAFGLSLALGRYEDRRAATVPEANAIGTSYLRSQLLAEPVRTRSLQLWPKYTDLALQVSQEVPDSTAVRRTTV